MDDEAQKNQKIATLRALLKETTLPEIRFQSFGPSGLRSRLDFVIENENIGLYSHTQKQIVDLPECLQLSEPLQIALAQFRALKAPVKKGSFRLRVSPSGKVGIWLDFSNENIKELLESRDYLEALQKIGFVEIGQRHKALYEKASGELGLSDPQFHPWSETYFQGQKVPLLSTVASFTQPSHVSNAWITQKISEWTKPLGACHVLEFGSGIGNLSFPALVHSGSHLTALEYDGLSFQALKKNVEALLSPLSRGDTLSSRGAVPGRERMTLHKGDYRKNQNLDLSKFDLLLLNPARNGVGELLNQDLRSQSIIYMSCYPESFALDTQSLNKRGYSLRELVIVDQFPQTSHMEVLSLWELG